MTTSSPRSIEVTAIHDVTTGERRHYSRYPLALAGALVFDDVRAPCDITDFSGTGMGVTPRVDDNCTGLSTMLGDPEQCLNGRIVDIVFEVAVSGASYRVRARGQVVRVAREAGSARIGLKFVRTNPKVFDALVRESDRGLLAAPGSQQPDRNAAIGALPPNGWEIVSDYLSDVLDACFRRCTERLYLNAEYAAQDPNASERYFALVAVKATESAVRKAFVGEILEDAHSAYMTDTVSESSHTDLGGDTLTALSETLTRRFKSDVLDGLDDRAMLKMMARRKRSFLQWLPPGEEGAIAPAALFKTFKQVCEVSSFQDDTRALVLRSFREAIVLYWPSARRELLQCLDAERQPLVRAA